MSFNLKLDAILILCFLTQIGCEDPIPTLSNYIWVPYYVDENMGCDLRSVVGTLEECGELCDNNSECSGFVVYEIDQDEDLYFSGGYDSSEYYDTSRLPGIYEDSEEAPTVYLCSLKKDFPYFSRIENADRNEYQYGDVSLGEEPSSYLKVGEPEPDSETQGDTMNFEFPYPTEEGTSFEESLGGDRSNNEEGTGLMSIEEEEPESPLMSVETSLKTHRLFCSIKDLRLQQIPKVDTCAFILQDRRISKGELNRMIDNLGSSLHRKFELCFYQNNEACIENKDGVSLYRTCKCDEIFLEQCAWYLRRQQDIEHPLNDILEAEYEQYMMCQYNSESDREYCDFTYMNQKSLDKLEQRNYNPYPYEENEESSYYGGRPNYDEYEYK